MIDGQVFSIRETRRQLPKLVELTSLTGKRFVVSKYGKPKVAIVPIPEELLSDSKKITDYFGFMNNKGESGKDLVNRVRRNKKEREYIQELKGK